jgi:hypothetical protein
MHEAIFSDIGTTTAYDLMLLLTASEIHKDYHQSVHYNSMLGWSQQLVYVEKLT